MKKYFTKISVLLITLSLGIAAAWGLNLLPGSLVGFHETPRISKLKQADPDAKVLVLFNGFSTVKNEVVAKFEIINVSDKPVRYSSFEEKGNLFHLVKYNGDELREFLCGTGLEKYELAPNDSILIEKDAAYTFRNNFEENGVYQLSFSLGVNADEYESFWSPEFRIPESIKEQIRKQNENELRQ